MRNRERLRQLTSGNTTEILEALRDIKLDYATEPSDDVLDAGLKVMTHPEPDIRQQAVWAFCLHWGDKRTVPLLRALLDGRETDLEVLCVAARSVGSMFGQRGGLDEETRRVLARVALDESQDAELRGISYISLRLASGLLTSIEQSRLRIEDDIREQEVDWSWLRAAAE